MTQMDIARSGRISDELAAVAKQEGVDAETLRRSMAAGRVSIPHNPLHEKAELRGVGEGLKVKVNANIGASPDHEDMEQERLKLKAALDAGADAIMDLSIAGELGSLRGQILENCPVPLGTVPIYQAATDITAGGRGIVDLTIDDILRVVEEQAREGVDFMTLHTGLTLGALERMRKEGRVLDIVSRGGSFLACWMVANKAENPLYENFDKLVEIAHEYDVTLSLGDACRPGCLADATDRTQIHELITLGEQTQQAWDAGVQVIIEGPGHVPMNQIRANMELQKRLCHNAPFYVLGPLVTDVAAGRDHVACAIGGAIAADAGADFLCYVTPSEHLALPGPDDVYEGVAVTRIAAHAADIARGNPQAVQRDRAMAQARSDMDWDAIYSLCLDPATARKIRENRSPEDEEVCTMCGKFCAVKLLKEHLSGE